MNIRQGGRLGAPSLGHGAGRRAALRATVVAAAVAGVAFGGGMLPAHADAVSPYLDYRITTQASLAFDVAGGSLANGAEVIQWDIATGGGFNQRWNLMPTGSYADEYEIMNDNSSECLSVVSDGTSISDGAELIQWPCDGTPYEQWVFEPKWIGSTLEYNIASALNTDYVIDVPGFSANLGVQLEVWQNNGGLNQAFYLTALAP